MDPINPPSMFSSVEQDQLVFEINSAIESGKRKENGALQDYAIAGQKIIQAMKDVKHGEKGAWIEKNVKCSKRQAYRYMELAVCDVTSQTGERWAIINGNRDDELTEDDEPKQQAAKPVSAKPPPAAQPVRTFIFCMRCQKHGPAKDCRACHNLGEGRAANDDGGKPAATATSTRPAKLPEPTEQPKPAPLTGRLTKYYEGLDQALAAGFKTRAVDREIGPRTHEAMQVVSQAVEVLSKAATRRPGAAKCRDCGQPITWAVTENDKMIALQDGKGFEIIGGVAVAVEKGAGSYRSHFISCTKGNQEAF